MIFNSFEFLLFFPFVIFIYFLISHKYRWIFLLAASLFFYMYWNPIYILLIFISTLVDYLAGLLIFKNRKQKSKYLFLVISLTLNLLILIGFKYFNFIIDNLNLSFEILNIDTKFKFHEILLPVGISFYTFQSMSYTIDVYRGNIIPERNLARFELYVTFFPQLVAGPIERAESLMKQLKSKADFSAKRLSEGLKMMLWGFFQKVVIADNLSGFVTEVYNNPNGYFGWDIILIILFFAIQIYCDFAGYTNIAIGTAHILGIKLMKNFEQPYFAISIRDFWKRWHISLSTWFRDYFYISLGGNKNRGIKWILVIFSTFLISGFWHGANWTFLIWGGIHGLFYLTETFLKKIINIYFIKYKNLFYNRITMLFRIIFTFFVVCFAWIFFRAANIQTAFILIKNSFKINSIIPHFSFDKRGLLVCFFVISILFIVDLIEQKRSLIEFISFRKPIVRWIVYYIMLLMLIGLGNWGLNEFIYFQF